MPGSIYPSILGNRAEQAVSRYFQDLGFQILAHNYLVPRIGELDLVLLKKNLLTIVEVKARSHSESFGGLSEAITPSKLARIRKTAWCYLKENHMMNYDVTFLAALVNIDQDGNVLKIRTEPVEWI